jgi:hypothetical protein
MVDTNFKNLGGMYNVELVLASPNYPKGFLWKLGSLELDIPSRGPRQPSSQEIVFHSLPEIRHVFATPETRPAKIISLFFAILTFVPFLLLLMGVGDSYLIRRMREGYR